MSIQLINIGFGNMVSANRIIAVISPESAPVKRVISEARDKGLLIDATYGRKTRAVIITVAGLYEGILRFWYAYADWGRI